MRFEYAAISSLQMQNGKRIILFSAPVNEILFWGGIPQKKKMDGEIESAAGFQRSENYARLKNIAKFLTDPNNTIQNPLLCSVRDSADCSYSFTPLGKRNLDLGHFVIELPDFTEKPLVELFKLVREHLESRIPDLKLREIPEKLISKLQISAQNIDSSTIDENITLLNSGEFEENEEASEVAVFNESHIVEFWEEVAARQVVLEKMGEYTEASFLGFTKEVLTSYLKPVVVVDGQHRLRGALAAAEMLANEEEGRNEAELLIKKGLPLEEVEQKIMSKYIRELPISLILDSDPSEHVFQFVVVNQKATPIGKALLGTIVSTSLTTEELDAVGSRLLNAGIPLEESRAASYMARHPNSPFYNLVDLGLTTSGANMKLAWPVFVSLVNIFRELKGGIHYNDGTDFAADWRRILLFRSELVKNPEKYGFETAFDYWRSFDGPWKEVFIVFWSEIKRRFSNNSDDQNYSYWGNPRRSNLFNKISLNILAADFFLFLNSDRSTINSFEHLRGLIEKWLSDLDDGYFERDWELQKAGVKKDSPGIRKKWASLWSSYRASPTRLPRREEYSKPSLV